MLGLWKKAVPQPEPVDLQAVALTALEDTKKHLTDARQNLQTFADANFRIAAGGLLHVSCGFNKEQLDELVVAYERALTQFHAALAEWANRLSGDG